MYTSTGYRQTDGQHDSNLEAQNIEKTGCSGGNVQYNSIYVFKYFQIMKAYNNVINNNLRIFVKIIFAIIFQMV